MHRQSIMRVMRPCMEPHISEKSSAEKMFHKHVARAEHRSLQDHQLGIYHV